MGSPACLAGDILDAAINETHMALLKGDVIPISCFEGMVGVACVTSENGATNEGPF